MREECFLLSGKEGKVLFAGVRNVSLAGDKRVRSLVEMEKCSFFQREKGMFSFLREDSKIPRGEGEMFLFSERSRNILRARELGREKGSFEPGEK